MARTLGSASPSCQPAVIVTRSAEHNEHCPVVTRKPGVTRNRATILAPASAVLLRRALVQPRISWPRRWRSRLVAVATRGHARDGTDFARLGPWPERRCVVRARECRPSGILVHRPP